MANTNILQLPIAIGLDGSEYFPLTQGGTTKRCATGLLEQFTSGGSLQDANKVFAGPASGGAAAPSFRSLVADDLPTVPPTKGGTGFTSFTVGDLFYADSTTSLAKLAGVATGNVLLSGGVGVAPAYGKVDAATHITGILPVANGGTGNSALAALTKTDDTNVTLTLGGSPSTALVNAASIAVGWTGELSIARGGTGQSTANAAFNALSPMTTNGDIITRAGGIATRVAVGTIGTGIMSTGTGPSYQSLGWISVALYGATGSGLSDETALIQACIDANKGKTIFFPRGTYLVGTTVPILIDGATYDDTTLVFEDGAELVMAPRPTATSYNYYSAWSTLVVRLCDNIGIYNLRVDGNRASQPVQEHMFSLWIAGATNVRVFNPVLRELRGDGIYISESIPNTSSVNTSGVFMSNVIVRNAAVDGRNAVSIVSGENITLNGLVCDRMGGTFLYVNAANPAIDPAFTCTISNASPAVVTAVAHGRVAGDPVYFTTTGSLPTGLTPTTPGTTGGTPYYVIAAGLTADTFQVSATLAGPAINTSSAGSGVQTCVPCIPVVQPGGFDIEPNFVHQLCRHIVATNLRIISAGTTPIAVQGEAADRLVTSDVVVSDADVYQLSPPTILDGSGNMTITNNQIIGVNSVTDVKVSNVVGRFVNAYGVGVIASDSDDVDVKNVRVTRVHTGSRIGNETRDAAGIGVWNSNFNISVNDVVRYGFDVGKITNCTVSGWVAAALATHYTARYGVICQLYAQTDSTYSVSIQASTNWTRSYRQNGASYVGTLIQNCNLGDLAGWTSSTTQAGDIEIPKVNVKGVTDRAVVPTGGSWVAGDFVKANGVPGVVGWLRMTTGSTNTAVDWLISGLDMMTVLSTDFTGADSLAAQPVFAAAQDTFAASASTTYEFDAVYWIVRAAGTTSHTTSVLFGGTATFTSVEYLAQVTNPTGNALANVQQIMGSGAGALVLTAANTSATENVMVKLRGIIRINAAGTLIPQFQYSAAPGGAPSIKRNSYFRLKVMGTNTATIIGNWS